MSKIFTFAVELSSHVFALAFAFALMKIENAKV